MNKLRELGKVVLIGALISAVVAIPIAYFSSATFLATMFLIWGALWVNSSILTWVDVMPGGFEHVSGNAPKEHKGFDKFRFWSLTLAGCLLLFGLCAYFFNKGV